MNPTRTTVRSLPARIRRPLLPCLLPALLAVSGLVHASASAPEDMAALYKTTCAICHEVPETKAPPTDTLRRLPAANILMAMEFGKMQPQASVLKQEQRVKLAKWLAADEDAKRDAWIAAKACAGETPVPVTGRANWGLGRDNTRAAEGVRIDRDNLGRLELLWSVALPSVTTMRSQHGLRPLVARDRSTGPFRADARCDARWSGDAVLRGRDGDGLRGKRDQRPAALEAAGEVVPDLDR
jgi:cytochrome c553